MKNELTVIKSVEDQATEIMARIKVFERNEELWTDSLSVAAAFEKTHDNLLKVIRKINEENQVVSLVSFNEAEYIDAQGKPRPFFEMTETGFSSVVGGFNDRSGTDIALIKAMYRKEFHRLKQEERNGIVKYRIPDELQSLLSGLIISQQKFSDSVREWKGDIQIEQKETIKVVGFIGAKVDKLELKVDGFEGKLDNLVKLNERRRAVSAKDKSRHILCLYSLYSGTGLCT